MLTPPSSEGNGSPVNVVGTSAFPMLDACAPIDALYEPPEVTDVGFSAFDGLLESMVSDGGKWTSVPTTMALDPASAVAHPNSVASNGVHVKERTGTMYGCGYGGKVGKDETVGEVYQQFGFSPYVSK